MEQLLAILPVAVPVGLFVIAVCVGMGQVRTFRRGLPAEADEADLRYYRSQFRRRIQITGILGLLALGMLAGQWIPERQYPSLFVIVWSVMGLLACWIALLAVLDLVALRRHALRKFHGYLQEKTRLVGEVHRLRREAGRDRNGHPGSSSSR